MDVDTVSETFVDGAVCGIRGLRIVDGKDGVVGRGEAPGPGGQRPVLGVEDESGGDGGRRTRFGRPLYVDEPGTTG